MEAFLVFVVVIGALALACWWVEKSDD